MMAPGLVSRVPRRWRRLSQMPARELAGRTRQHVARWVERAAPTSWPPPADVLARDAPRFAASPAERFDECVRTRFFAGAADPDATARAILAHAPEAAAAIVAAADRNVEGRFDLLGYRDLDPGQPIDWHRDPVSGRQAPRVHWSLLDPLDAAAVGDSKVTWELSRHQWMLLLAQAFLFTGDERYLETAAARFDDWLVQNPPGSGLNWASSLEASYRLIAWSWTFALLRKTRFTTPARLSAAAAAIARHARHVARYLSHYFSPNTHLTGEALGLIYASALLPDHRGAASWHALGRQVLLDELDRQITRDGAHFERASCYHRYTVEIYLHVIVLCQRAGDPLPARLTDAFTAMTSYLTSLCDPDATMPNVGDADGGWLAPFVPRDPQDCRGALDAAAVLAGQPPHLARHEVAPDALWIHGVGAATSIGAAAAPIETCAFDVAGTVIMRSGWEPDGHRLLFDAGPLGCHVSGAHGHADLLSIAVRAFGEDVLIDPGTGLYSGPWRDYFRGSHAHSTLVVDDRSQAETDGPFSWRSRPAAALEMFERRGDRVVARGRHDAFSRPGDALAHRRSVTFVDRAYWIVVDDVDGVGEHALTLRYQCAALSVRRHDDRWTVVDVAKGALWIGIAGPSVMAISVHAGETDPPQGWISRRYGHVEPAPVLVARTRTRLPARVVTALVPSTDRETPPSLDFAEPAFDRRTR